MSIDASTLDEVLEAKNKSCSVAGCLKPARAKGLCDCHYKRLQKGSPMTPRSLRDPNEIRLYGSYAEMDLYDRFGRVRAITIIDSHDVPKIQAVKWALTTGDYVTGTKNRLIKLHRFIMDAPEDMVVDHINHNPLDNRRCNLRICTRAENMRNRVANQGHPFRVGVYYNTNRARTKPWYAQIQIPGASKKRLNKNFSTYQEAVTQREAWERQFYGEFAVLEVIANA